MKLWTWQGPTWDITSGEIDHSLSPYIIHNDAHRIREAYVELYKRLKKKVVWYYTNKLDAERPLETMRVQWMLDVPSDAILTYTDDWVWERIIGSGAYPELLRIQWMLEAPVVEPSRTQYIEQKTSEYLTQSPPNGDWWLELFVPFAPPPPSVKMVSALLEHPIDESWVVHDPRHH